MAVSTWSLRRPHEPFLALRSYLPADHPDKAKEIGSEPTPAAFLDTLLRLTAEWRRLLAPHGSICVELGDTYSGSGGAGGDYDPGGFRDGQPRALGSAKWDRSSGRTAPGGQPYANTFKGGGPGGNGWPMPKSLCGIPHLYHLSLAYGRNLLTGEPSPAGQWRVRNVVAWCRPNPPVGALGDKFRPGTSYLTIACVSDKRYFDLDSCRSALKDPENKPRSYAEGSKTDEENGQAKVHNSDGQRSNPAGAPPLDWWEIPTQPYKGAHYATWPAALCEKPIKAMVPRRVCTTCGEPSRRIMEASYIGAKSGKPYEAQTWDSGLADGKAAHTNKPPDEGARSVPITLGWTDCGHDTWRNGLVLDPFVGSGTTLAVATGHGRDAIGIDLDPRNVALVEERVGRMFLEVDQPAVPA